MTTIFNEITSTNAIEEFYKLKARLSMDDDVKEINKKYRPINAGRPVNPSSAKQTIIRLLDEGKSCPQIQSITKFDIQMIYSYKTRFWKKEA